MHPLAPCWINIKFSSRRESNPGRLRHRRALYLKSYLDSLCTDYSEPLHRSPSACVIFTHGLNWADRLTNVERSRIIDFFRIAHAGHVRVTTIERLDQGHLYPLAPWRTNIKFASTGRLRHRRALYLNSYLNSYSDPLQ